ncbi:MAG TPA: hypothetical protein VJ810_31220 [Blastocatellia bacterium]|nr:hypothetical protein [Blastocatellia bacterium]
MKTRIYSGLALLLCLVLFACAVPANAQAPDIYNNTNIEGVNNGPTTSPQFSLKAPARITQIVTYHWNFGRGARPGAISLRNSNGQVFGPFAAVGSSGQGGAANVNWVATVNVTIPAGSYTVLDSDPNTWSNNARSGFRGFAIVRGSLLPAPPASPPAPAPAPACQPAPSVYIRNIRYDDYSRYTSLSTTSVAPGGFFRIQTSCLPLNGQIVVTLQDVNRGPGSGVTAFRLTNVSVSGNVVTAQAPDLPIFQNRTYHVALFVYGRQPFKTASPGQITIR